ncbi:hypothetical protein A5886_000940 [Enterococcus sp. 8G7_MSG3316]|uniref:Polysaccharide biosynthesis protein C-terminal domain-containing protein n=1 Tax=Candidatus Enterococcus testudinis TaxID=1834191 RepID=A0A242A4B6_9ENTE|nr:lipopolysaccharide biosynthesis protein [Enterococcus sp. 8G7_MSG3316]OTN75864.1 hypothetical protein A5886_000940 [Enterococcus sp. 8G7_MSG3316]
MSISAKKGLTVTSISTIISFIIQTLTTIILARIFTPNQFGEMAAVAIVTSYADIIWQLGLGPAIIQKSNISKKDLSTANGISIFLGLISFIGVLLLANPISSIVGLENEKVLMVTSVSFLINSISVVPNSLLQKELEFTKIATKEILGNFCYLIFSVFFGLNGYGIWALVFANILRYLVSLMLVLFFTKDVFQISNLKIFIGNLRQMARFGFGYSISRFLNVTTGQIDYLVVSKTMGTTSLGIYSRAFQLMTIPANLIGQVVDLVYFPVMSKIQNNNQELARILRSFTNIMSILYFPVAMTLFIFSDTFVYIILGGNWGAVSDPLRILGLSLFFRVGYKITDPIYRSKGAVYKRASLHLVQAIVTGLLAYLGYIYGGINGVSIGVSLSLFLNYFLNLYGVSKLLGIHMIKSGVQVLTTMFISYVFIFPLEFVKGLLEKSNINDIIAFILLIACWAIAMVIIFIIYKIIYMPTKGFKEILKNIRKSD